MFVFLFLGLFPTAFAADTPTFEGYAAKLLQHPQRLELLEAAEQQRLLGKGELGLPDPMLGVGFNNLPVSSTSFHEDRMTSKTVGFSQAIPNPALRKAKAAKQGVLAAKTLLQADYTTQKLKALLVEAVAQQQKNKAQITLAQKQLKHYRSLEDYFKGQLESGGSVYWRFAEIDVDRTLVEQRLNDLEAEKAALEAALIRLVGDVPPTTLPLPPLNPKPLVDITETYPLQLQNKALAVAGESIRTAKADILPDFGLEAAYMQRDSVGNVNVNDLFSVKAKISIPLWYGSNQKPKLAAAQAEKRAAQQTVDDTTRQWTEQLKTLWAKISATEENIQLLKDKKQSLKEITAATRRLYEAGNGGLDMVLGAEISRLDIAHALEEKKAAYHTLVATYNSHFIGGF